MTISDSIEIKDALVYSQRTFLLGGVWPQQPNNVLFVATLCYQSLVMVLGGWGTYDARNHFQLLLLDLSELIFEVAFILAFILVRLSDSLRLVTDETKGEIRDGKFLRNDEERRLYHRYNTISWKFGKYVTGFQAAIITLMYLRPSIDLLVHAVKSDTTVSYNLPFQAHIFFDYKNDTMRYILLYVYQIPVTYLSMFHAAEVSYVVTMVLHLCGKYSILCFRIRNVSTKPSSLFRDHIKSVVNQHLMLRQTTEILNDDFDLLLLIEYVSCSSRLSLSMYLALTTFETDPVAATNFIMYSLDVIAYLYLYSYIGEQLRCESESVSDALYDIEWTDVSNKDRKILLTCMINGCQAKYLTAGKFYKFSLFGFTRRVEIGWSEMLQSSDSIEIKDSLVYCQRIFAVGGVLPQQHSPKLFKLIILYFFHLVTMQLWDLYDTLHDFQALLVNATEMPVTISILCSLVLIRTNKKLFVVVENIQRDIKGTMFFKSDEEKRLYRKYNIISVYFGKYVSVFAFIVGYMIYVRPLIALLIHPRTDGENNTRPFVLPFRSHVFFDYHYNAKVYILMYIYQLPIAFLAMYHAAEASLIVTSTLHVCARLSVLARRIRMSLTESSAHFQERMRTMVIEHLELMELSGFLNDCFQHLLLIEYLNCSFRLGISMYVVLITLGRDTVASVNFILYTIIVIAWLYLYSYIGEQLTYESRSIGDAFYDTDWTEMASRDRKSLVLCVINGQRAQYLMAGKFYKYTLFGFSDIVKTSIAFFSVLRTNVE
ncbi:uncharacterized protein LOC143355684 [Halictus rubicundus]|uniref:uncharacterized protein LOC143355684 n=1 Tax=Halictus rubicundus TaxID=77578 RepID=UPI0040359E3E